MIVGPEVRSVKASGLVLLCFLLLAGCFWRRYPQLVVLHADLLAEMAAKGRDVLVTGRFGPETMPELMYPLERAEAFAADAKGRAGDTPPRSLTLFTTLVGNYRQFVQTLDDLRRKPPEQLTAERPTLDATVTALSRQADVVRAAATGGE